VTWTLRRRILLAVLVAAVIGHEAPGFVRDVIQPVTSYGQNCWDHSPKGPQATSRCDAGENFTLLWPIGLRLVVAVIVVIVAVRWATGWILAPVVSLITPIASMGPQNLTYRISAQVGDPEVGRLSLALNSMMDRIAAGYEGQRRFAANASHELRTPLAVQRTLIEVGMAEPLSDDQFQLLTRQLLRTNERNERLIENLLVLSEADQGLVVRAPQHLDRIVATVIEEHRARAAQAGLAIETELKPCVVPGEYVLLERLAINLIQNAIKYNRPEGTIHVAVGGSFALAVTNTGQAVPPEKVDDIFEPFRRLSNDRTDQSEGSGLGLTIARSIVQAHGGTIRAHPQGTDGLRIEIGLPIAPGHSSSRS
jgi:signal transduction histidine kinase